MRGNYSVPIVEAGELGSSGFFWPGSATSATEGSWYKRFSPHIELENGPKPPTAAQGPAKFWNGDIITAGDDRLMGDETATGLIALIEIEVEGGPWPLRGEVQIDVGGST